MSVEDIGKQNTNGIYFQIERQRYRCKYLHSWARILESLENYTEMFKDRLNKEAYSELLSSIF